MLINEMFKDGYIFSVSTLIGNSLNKDTKNLVTASLKLDIFLKDQRLCHSEK